MSFKRFCVDNIEHINKKNVGENRQNNHCPKDVEKNPSDVVVWS